MSIDKMSENCWNFGCPKGVEKKWTFAPRDLPFSKLQIWNLKIYIPHFVWKSRMIIKGIFLSFSLITEWMNMNEYMIKTFMLLKDFREPFLSFELTYFRNSFCYRIENNWSLKYKIFSRVGPLGTNLILFVSFGIAEISRLFKVKMKCFFLLLNLKEQQKSGRLPFTVS